MIRENLGGLLHVQNKPIYISPTRPQIGKVFGVVLNENTPSKELFDKAGGWSGIGTVFYLDYEQSKNIDIIDLNGCNIAKPFHSSNQNYPLIGELILLTDGPSPSSQLDNISIQKYYLGTINIWNNNQQNALSGNNLGKTFIENGDIRNLFSFEGDRIYQGRKGNGIRFGSTVSRYSNINEWSKGGRPDGDPITILVNGYVTTDTGSLSPNIEEVNKELSSVYLTSTQLIPLKPGSSIKNPIFTSIEPKNYINPQVILNSDRIIINSKKDEILLFSKTNIELTSDNITNINSGNYIHLNIEPKNKNSKILLGTKSDGTVPTEPVLLGNQTHDLLLEMCKTLSRLAGYLSIATATTSDGSIPIVSCNDAGTQLFTDIDSLISKLENITSNKVYTV